jgi:hypothetical protein
MNRTRAALIVGGVLVLIGAGAWIALQPDQPHDDPREDRSLSQPKAVTWETLDIGAFADAEIKIERLRKQSEVDWSAIRVELQKTLPVVRSMDLRRGLSYEADMAAALSKCEQGELPKVNQQVIAKGLQHVAVLGLTQELSLLARDDTADKRKLLARIEAFSTGIRPTFVRRDKDYFDGKPTLAAELDQALSALEQAVDKKTSPAEASRALNNAIHRTYALSVLYEIEQIEKLRQTDLDACEVKRAEAVIFYRIISSSIAKAKPQAHAEILVMLEAPFDQMSATSLKTLLGSGLPS